METIDIIIIILWGILAFSHVWKDYDRNKEGMPHD